MNESLEVNSFRVVPPATVLEALLFVSRQLQARASQLIQESRELRTTLLLVQHTYGVHHQFERHPDLLLAILPILKRRRRSPGPIQETQEG